MSTAADHLYGFVVVESEARHAQLLVDEFLPAWREHGGLRPRKVILRPSLNNEGVVVEVRWCEINDLSNQLDLHQSYAMSYLEWKGWCEGGPAAALRSAAKCMCEHPDIGHYREDLAEEKP